MFVLRSLFWLTLAFVLIAPHGSDLGATATALRNQAVEAGVEAGQQLIVSQLASPGRLPELMLSAVSPAAAPQPKSILPSSSIFPRPRPAALS